MSSSIPSHVTSVEMSVSFTPDVHMKPSSNTSQISVSTPTSLMSGSGMSGLLNSRNLVQDEKLVVATLATLNSGNASTLIKQDLKWIIQSRRRAEGKSEIQVEFKKPVKDELTSEEVVKRARRRELNRLAARRSRERGQRKKDRLVEEIHKLQSQNTELIHILGNLSDERDSIINTLRQHMKECSDHNVPRFAATGLSEKVLEKLGMSEGDSLSSQKEIELSHSPPHLYICTSPDATLGEGSYSTPSHVQTQSPCFSSGPSSPVIVGLSGKPLILEDKSHTSQTAAFMNNPGSSSSLSPMLPESTLTTSSSLSSSSTSQSMLTATTTPSYKSPSTSNPHFSSKSSAERDKKLLPPPFSCHLSHGRRNSSHTFDHDHSHTPVDADVHSYKFTRPASPPSRPPRFSLERSYSFPSSHSETRVDFTPGMCFTSVADSDGFDRPYQAARPESSFNIEEQEAPLNLVVRKKNGDSRRETHVLSFKDDRGSGRRRSVDDVMHSSSYREPLNLSSTSATSVSHPNLSQYDLSHINIDRGSDYNSQSEPYS